MTIEEFKKLVETYGTESGQWPESIREECLSFLASNVEAQSLLTQHQELNELMNQIEVPEFPSLQSRVLNQALPEQDRSLFDQILDWLLPANNFGKQIWRPAMVACLPLVFGIVIGNFFSFGIGMENDGFSYWEDELTMLSLNDYSENLF